ncbi:MAG TPA: isochorismatase family protein [Candidatus Limnocylindria bacterium]|nr:isochorismatase family protein [Candidatus Limnocylindria bacterium]
MDLPALLAPPQAALLLMECQEGVIGAGAHLGQLAQAVARHGTVAAIARVLAAARRARVPVFHCLMAQRPDRAGSVANCRLLALGRKGPPTLLLGSPQQAPVAPLAPLEGEWVVNRHHGLTPFHGTELDQLLRNTGVRTVVATGVSVNVGILGLAIEAVNAGYQVVIPREAVAGTPDDYVDAVLQHTLGLLATIVRVDDVEGIWR